MNSNNYHHLNLMFSQVLTTREDHVMKVTHPDGTLVVEHADGTRITSYTREVEVQTNDDSHKETGELLQEFKAINKFFDIRPRKKKLCSGFPTHPIFSPRP